MRVILGICVGVSFAFPVFADPQLGEKTPAVKKNFEKSIAEASAKISNLEKTKAELAQKIYDSARNITSAEKTMKNAQDASGGAPLTDKQLGIFRKTHADYLKAKSEFEPALLKAKVDLAKVDQELEALQQSVKTEKAEKFSGDIQGQTATIYNEKMAQADVANADMQNTILKNRFRTVDLRSAFMDLDIKKLGVEATLNDMEKDYDKSVLGAYLQDKFGQLLNSQVICSAVKRCPTNDPKKIEPERIRKELFPESAADAVRSDYYEKVNKKQATPVQ
jgi:prefoldin subunit 5